MKLLLNVTVATLICVGSATAADPISLAKAPDSGRGAQLYEGRCGGCHSLDANRVGPRHRGLLGRRAGGVADYGYSPALGQALVVWTDQTLDRWLSDPEALVPGQRMNIRVTDPIDRADIIAYLKQESRQ